MGLEVTTPLNGKTQSLPPEMKTKTKCPLSTRLGTAVETSKESETEADRKAQQERRKTMYHYLQACDSVTHETPPGISEQASQQSQDTNLIHTQSRALL